MTQDEIIEMAKQAGGIDITNNYVGVTVWLGTDRLDFLEAFAKLVAEKEREACALVADEAIDFWVKRSYPESAEVREAQNIAESIRARGQA